MGPSRPLAERLGGALASGGACASLDGLKQASLVAWLRPACRRKLRGRPGLLARMACWQTRQEQCPRHIACGSIGCEAWTQWVNTIESETSILVRICR